MRKFLVLVLVSRLLFDLARAPYLLGMHRFFVSLLTVIVHRYIWKEVNLMKYGRRGDAERSSTSSIIDHWAEEAPGSLTDATRSKYPAVLLCHWIFQGFKSLREWSCDSIQMRNSTINPYERRICVVRFSIL